MAREKWVSTLLSAPAINDNWLPDATIVVHEGQTLDFVRALPDQQMRLIITSPPYNLGKAYEEPKALADYMKEQEAVIVELIRCLATNGSLCWEVGNFVQDGEVVPLDVLFYPVFKQHGLKLRNRVIWHFGHGLHASRRFSGRYETLLWFTKSDKYVFNLDPVRVPAKYPGKTFYKGRNQGKPSGNPLGANPSDIWTFLLQEWESEFWEIPNVKANHPEKTEHPCQFPVELVERCVLALTNDDDWVFDPYMGVGSTLIAGLMRGRRVVGCDKEAEYVALARQRVNDYWQGRLKVRKMGTPIYTPTGREKVSQIPIEWNAGGSSK